MVISAARPFMQGGKIVYSQGQNLALLRYQEAVKRATFLNDKEKKNWVLLAYFMDEKELKQAKLAIIDEDLNRMKVRQQLRHLKIKK